MLDLHLPREKNDADLTFKEFIGPALINIITKKYEQSLKVFLLYGIIIIILHWGLFWILNYMDIEERKSYNRIVPTIGWLGIG